MKNKYNFLGGIITSIVSGVMLLTSCIEEEKNWETILFEKGTFDATASVNVSDTVYDINGDSVVFTDLSTKVYSRQWTFQGGTPASSNDSVVTVRYFQSSAPDTPFVATLTVKYLDNTTQTRNFYITAKGRNFLSYSLFTEDITITPGTEITLEPNSGYTMTTITDAARAFEGEKTIFFEFGSAAFAMGTIKPAPWGTNVDISAFENGTYNIAIKTSCKGIFVIRMQSGEGGTQRALVTIDPVAETYGLKRDGNWHMLSIPIADFLANNPALDLTDISSLFVLRSDPEVVELPAGEDWDFYVDNFYLEVEQD
ncbi:MAG: hypothetical protein JXB34_07125 [Bacteroidales bacterium]|nr:hypothetical protein [Bacteroidales bacterium]